MIEWLLIKLLVTLQMMIMRKTGPDRRGQHPKTHGCVTAEFTVERDIPEHLRMGVFAKPQTFKTIIRFSNGAKDDDRLDDVHGMAIKLLEVDGRKILKGEERETTQDFVLADHPVFLARNIWHLMQFIRWKSKKEKLKRTHPAYEGYSKPAPDCPLMGQYWSQTPYRLGGSVVRYEARPKGEAEVDVDRSSPDFSRLSMVDYLNNLPAEFDFLVQTAPDESRRWSEDPSRRWDTAAVKVATITILPQQFDTPAKRQFGEDLCYTPWHSLPEHEPLSQINRARREVYRASAKKRHKHSGGQMREPTIDDLKG